MYFTKKNFFTVSMVGWFGQAPLWLSDLFHDANSYIKDAFPLFSLIEISVKSWVHLQPPKVRRPLLRRVGDDDGVDHPGDETDLNLAHCFNLTPCLIPRVGDDDVFRWPELISILLSCLRKNLMKSKIFNPLLELFDYNPFQGKFVPLVLGSTPI